MECFCKEQSYDLMLEADIGADPIWCSKCGCNLDIDDVPLSQELKKELYIWVENYSETVLDESEYVYKVAQNHNKIGLKLLEKVQKEFGVRYTAIY